SMHPGHRSARQNERDKPRHASDLLLPAAAAITDEAIVPTTATVSTGANSGPAARMTLSANATPNTPGEIKRRPASDGAPGANQVAILPPTSLPTVRTIT